MELARASSSCTASTYDSCSLVPAAIDKLKSFVCRYIWPQVTELPSAYPEVKGGDGAPTFHIRIQEEGNVLCNAGECYFNHGRSTPYTPGL